MTEIQHIPVGREFGPCKVKIKSDQLTRMLVPCGQLESEGVIILRFGEAGVTVELTSRKMADNDLSLGGNRTISYEEFAERLLCGSYPPKDPGPTLGYV